mmetsp:Transcript_26483/g.60497  ORF Transcript_26483/g.60497 Transcript_26483/m.60497 type:complete len:82 (-) Transcript_26483:2564-2809(-)
MFPPILSRQNIEPFRVLDTSYWRYDWYGGFEEVLLIQNSLHSITITDQNSTRTTMIAKQSEEPGSISARQATSLLRSNMYG